MDVFACLICFLAFFGSCLCACLHCIACIALLACVHAFLLACFLCPHACLVVCLLAGPLFLARLLACWLACLFLSAGWLARLRSRCVQKLKRHYFCNAFLASTTTPLPVWGGVQSSCLHCPLPLKGGGKLPITLFFIFALFFSTVFLNPWLSLLPESLVFFAS